MLSKLFSTADISASGMSAERMRMETVANNIANANSTRSADGGPYRRKHLVFSSMVDSANASSTTGLKGVQVMSQQSDDTPFPEVYSPGHPDADENGIVRMPNVKLPNEMIDLITASRSYEANLKALTSFKEMVEQTLTLLRGSR